MKFFVKHRHWGLHAAIVFMAAGCIADWLPIGDRAHQASGAVFVGAMVFSFGIQRLVHLGRLCEDCLRYMPVDPEKAVKRRKLLLAYVHRLSGSKAAMAAYLGLLLGCSVGSEFLTTLYSTSYNLVNTMVTLAIVVTVYSSLTHMHLQRWCPYCKGWDEGGDHEPSPDPIVPETA